MHQVVVEGNDNEKKKVVKHCVLMDKAIDDFCKELLRTIKSDKREKARKLVEIYRNGTEIYENFLTSRDIKLSTNEKAHILNGTRTNATDKDIGNILIQVLKDDEEAQRMIGAHRNSNRMDERDEILEQFQTYFKKKFAPNGLDPTPLIMQTSGFFAIVELLALNCETTGWFWSMYDRLRGSTDSRRAREERKAQTCSILIFADF